MIYKELGQTGIRLPEIAMGTWRYQGGADTLRAGVALGATFIDTAESYGTEEVVSQAIKGIRDQIFLATKVSPRHFRRADLIRAAEGSLKRLNTDYIDLYQLHWPNYYVPIAETMSAMEELVEMGKVRFIGVSKFSVAELRRAQATLSKNKIVSNQVRYSLVDRTIEDGLLQYCELNHITILAFSPLAHVLEHVRQYDRENVLSSVSAATGKSWGQVALNWCICRKPVIAIFKADRVEHVRENCGASGWYLPPDQVSVLDRQVRFQQWGPAERFARRLARRVLQRFGRSV